jgi:hypothetical protein
LKSAIFTVGKKFAYIPELRDPSPYPDSKEAGTLRLWIEEARSMKAYVVITAKAGTAREIANAMMALPGVQMADACWSGGDVYAVVEFPAWPDLNALVLDKVHSMPGVIRTETHVAVER